MASYEDLMVWKDAMDFAEKAFRLTRRFPFEERFELASQLKRSAASVPSNIAEGQQRNSRGEFVYFLGVARGSLAEALTQIRLAGRLDYLESVEVVEMLEHGDRIGRMLNGLRSSLRPTTRN
ncbi:MAG: four helix bundle protein [Deltaproteobacteria bacterium]|nr:four helix bundle protein [Deltaproteobacteria bacterium]